ncbi:unnamed protein product [Hermetia illucens]|uniref:Uncharacterized protein n=1 Tax=Hermetia illucens TaxID=343691 RepID=A0A7R8UKT9_HERIL|nr:unnamed protein product [Hermetia illucens]
MLRSALTRTTTTTTTQESKDDYDSSGSAETASDEIPVWIHGEQRWISGVNEETTCADLVNVLLEDEGLLCPSTSVSLNKNFVITERWRRVEQVLDNDTKILQIWSAWGHAKPEVKLTLRQIDPLMGSWCNSQHDQDSGMGSPNGSTNSAIIRRRRHRASKTTAAWVTQAQTIHPKSQKGTIEKLMKLILEQGETIQQQLAKLRDRELQIAKIEEDRHRMREREHGKNYLLETYLNGLHEAEEKEIVTVNSDSGVHTEGATSSPEIGIHENEAYLNVAELDDETGRPESYALPRNSSTYKGKSSLREQKLFKVHEQIKEYKTAKLDNSDDKCKGELLNCRACEEVVDDADESRKTEKATVEDDIAAKIEWMEKLVAINKHLQKEEELLVRLGAKIRKYESENPALNEQQIREALARVNINIDNSEKEMQRLENDLLIFNEKLQEKTNLLEVLNKELLVIEQSEQINSTKANALNLNSENLAENLYSFSQYISKPNYEFNENNENRDHKLLLRQHTPDHVLNLQNPLPTHSTNSMALQPPASIPLDQRIPPPAQYLDSTYPLHPPSQIPGTVGINHKVVQAPMLNCRNQNPLCTPIAMDIVTSMNLLQKPDPLKFNANVYSMSNPAAGPGASGKLGPKKLISGICNELESNSDTGLSSMGEDFTHAGTLV